MPTVLQIAREYRKKLRELEAETAADIIQYYQRALEAVLRDLAVLTQQIQDAKKAGKPISVAKLKREDRYKTLLATIAEEIGKFSGFAAERITMGQTRALELGQSGAKEMTMRPRPDAVVGYTWDRVPTQAVENIAGFLSNGSPLSSILNGLGADAASRAKQVMTSAVITGKNPRQTAQKMKGAFGGNLSRALTVARTEQLRAYRTATAESYRANSEVVEGWIRLETLDDLTCIVCIEEHGRFYTNESDFETHPNCRGTLIPKVVGVDREMETGPEWFARQPEDRQREILGKDKHDAYKAGEITLSDLNQRTYSEDWGGGRRVRTLEEAKEHAKNREPDPKVEYVPTKAEDFREVNFRQMTPYENGAAYKSAQANGEYTTEEIVAMKQYKGGGYEDIQYALRQGEVFPGTDQTWIDTTVRDIDKAIDRSVLPENTALFRGVELPENVDVGSMVGGVWTDKGYSSTSLSRLVGESFAVESPDDVKRLLIEYRMPQGSQALPIDGVSRMSFGQKGEHKWVNTDEHEFILARDQKFLIESATTYEKDAGGKIFDFVHVVMTPIKGEG